MVSFLLVDFENEKGLQDGEWQPSVASVFESN